jgi:hypothetical protein
MAKQLVPMRIDGVEVLVETVSVPGSEPTSRLTDAGERVRTAFDSAQDVIVSVAGRTVQVMRKLAESEAGHPATVEVELASVSPRRAA